MTIRSMTGYAQLTVAAQQAQGEDAAGLPGFTLTLKSVNHRFLDVHLRTPTMADALDIKLRRALKDKIARGHVELTLSIEPSANTVSLFNAEIVGNYIHAFRQAREQFALFGDADLNTALRLPGALGATTGEMNEALEAHILDQLDTAVGRLNVMREQEGASIEAELRERIARLSEAIAQVSAVRDQIAQGLHERIRSRITEMLSGFALNEDRILQEAAMIADRSDVQEEVARLRSHIEHFLSLLGNGGEVGKKLDFLLQEFNREANTLLSKTSGISAEGIKITEVGLVTKSEIEKLREQVQNLE